MGGYYKWRRVWWRDAKNIGSGPKSTEEGGTRAENIADGKIRYRRDGRIIL